MPFTHHFKPTHKEIKTYYEELAAYAASQVSHETAVRPAFQNLLAATCKKAQSHYRAWSNHLAGRHCN
jgi:hypothetical protein